MATNKCLGALLFFAGVQALSGCGGNGTNGGADFGLANPAYAGSYNGVYTNTRPSNQSVNSLTLSVTVTETGLVTGTAIEDVTGRTALVSGTLIDWFPAFSSDHRSLGVTFKFPGDSTREISGSAPLGDPSWQFNATYWLLGQGSGATRIGSGNLVLTKQ
ncbi:MAG: hypothetical protein ACHQ50_11975 [Fimbriimonadales bacterium]